MKKHVMHLLAFVLCFSILFSGMITTASAATDFLLYVDDIPEFIKLSYEITNYAVDHYDVAMQVTNNSYDVIEFLSLNIYMYDSNGVQIKSRVKVFENVKPKGSAYAAAELLVPYKTSSIEAKLSKINIVEHKHTTKIKEAMAPTCTQEGSTEYSYCSVCGEILTPQQIFPPLGHTIVTIPAVPATYSSTGLSEGQVCSVCGEVIVAQEIIPKKEDQITNFVSRCYSLILGRNADEGGLANWSNQLAAGVSNASQIISGFMKSPEYTGRNNTSADTVETLYNAMLGRASDPAGKQSWVEKLDASNNSDIVINGFCGSQEFLGLCAEYGIEAGSVPISGEQTASGLEGFVARCYSEALSRNADEGGFSYWCGILQRKEQTPQQVAFGFVYSQEMDAANKIVNNPDALLDSLYKLYLGRSADEGGKEYWKQRIAEGLTLDELNYGFAYSAEFSGIVQSYGLE